MYVYFHLDSDVAAVGVVISTMARLSGKEPKKGGFTEARNIQNETNPAATYLRCDHHHPLGRNRFGFSV